MKLKDMDKTEAWSSNVMLPVGWHTVTITEAEEGKSSNDNPQIELRLEGENGSIRDWLILTEKSMGKIKAAIVACGIEVKGGSWDFDAETMVGRQVRIFVGEEDDRQNPGQKRKRVMAYDQAGTDVPDDGDLPF